MKFSIFFLSILIINISAYNVFYPNFIKNKAIINNIDVNNLSKKEKIELHKLFNKIPVLIFKNQKIKPEEYYNFIKIFDPKHNNSIDLSNSKDQNINLVIKGSNNILNDDNDNDNYIWQQYITGSNKYLTPIVGSIYMLETSLSDEQILFASLEDAYDMINMRLKKILDRYTVLHSNSIKRQINCAYDYTGLRIDYKKNYNDDDITEKSLIIYSDKTKKRRTLYLNPKKFLQIKELNYNDSYNLYRHLMKKYILHYSNIIAHKWDNNDICVFNNRKLMHTLSPKKLYRDIIYLECKLPTNQKIYDIEK